MTLLSSRNSVLILLAMIIVSVRLPDQSSSTKNIKSTTPLPCESAVKSHQGASTGSKNASRNTAFHLQPEWFITQLEECVLDAPSKKCHIMYQHVGKTGGKGVEYLFFGLLGHKRIACCSSRMKEKFYENTSNYCPNPFQSFEVIDGFDQMVHQCNNDFYKNSPNNTKVILLTSVREPIGRVLSHIHQACNKNWQFKTNETTKEVCTACNFETHTEFWMKFPRAANGLYNVIRHQSTQSLQMFDHLYVDMVDLNKMATMLSERLSPLNDHYTEVFQKYFNKKHNPEKLDHCSFGLKSPMIKALKPAIETYREFVIKGSFL